MAPLGEGAIPCTGNAALTAAGIVSPVRPAAPAVAVVRAVRKAEPKPPPKKGLPQRYGNYSNIKVVLQHFGGLLATEQQGSSELNVCPWFKLERAGHCTWRAGRHLKPSRLHPKDLLDHVAKEHRSDVAQREQAEAMIKGVMLGGLARPFAVARAGSKALALPIGVNLSGTQEASSSATLSGARGSAALSSTGATGASSRAAHTGATRTSAVSERRARRRPPQGVGARARGRRPVGRRGRRARRSNQVQAALLLPANQTRRMMWMRRRCREEILLLTPGLHCLGGPRLHAG